MRKYDPEEPILYSHIPKTAGSSVRHLLQQAFGANFLTHYPRPNPRPNPRPPGTSEKSDLPERHNLNDLPEPRSPAMIYGHFNSQRGFGMADYYPHIRQCVAIFRDPWERVISGYFYRKRRASTVPVFRAVANMELEEYLAGWPFEDPKFGPPMSNFMPEATTPATCRAMFDKYFVAVGIAEELSRSVRHIGNTLNIKVDSADLPRLNIAPRPDAIPRHLKPAFEERNSLEYALYNYARDNYIRDGNSQ